MARPCVSAARRERGPEFAGWAAKIPRAFPTHVAALLLRKLEGRVHAAKFEYGADDEPPGENPIDDAFVRARSWLGKRLQTHPPLEDRRARLAEQLRLAAVKKPARRRKPAGG